MSALRCAKLLVPGLMLGLLASTPALAEDTHRYEVSLAWQNHDLDDSVEINIYQLGGQFYFAPVDATDKPLAEASFLDRIGSVALAAQKIDEDFKDHDGGVDGKGFLVQGTFARPNLPFVVSAAYGYTDYDYDPPLSSWEVSYNTYAIGAGYYLTDSLLASISYQQLDADFEDKAYGSEANLTSRMFGVDAKYVHLLSSTTAFNLETGYANVESEHTLGDTSNDWTIHLNGDYYFTNLISLGAGVAVHGGDTESQEGTTYLIRNKTYFTPHFGMGLEYSRFQASNDTGADEDTVGVSFLTLF